MHKTFKSPSGPTAYTHKQVDFRHHGSCREADPELFFPIGTTGAAVLQIEEAKAVCSRCPVMEQCLQWAQKSGESGVWGGLSEDERRAMKRRAVRNRAARNQAASNSA